MPPRNLCLTSRPMSPIDQVPQRGTGDRTHEVATMELFWRKLASSRATSAIPRNRTNCAAV
eukprot:1630480-Amphidinium_carterae.1